MIFEHAACCKLKLFAMGGRRAKEVRHKYIPQLGRLGYVQHSTVESLLHVTKIRKGIYHSSGGWTYMLRPEA